MRKSLVLCNPGYNRSICVAQALQHGLQATGWHVDVRSAWQEGDSVDHDLVAAYGWNWHAAYRAHSNYLYVDLGWWGRKPPHDLLNGYHRVMLNCRQQRLLLLPGKWPGDRWQQQGLVVQPWRTPPPDPAIMVIGMSAKAAHSWGLQPQEWEAAAIQRLNQLPCRVLYRPKQAAPALPGAQLLDHVAPIEYMLRYMDGVVTHSSSVAVDALVAGVPAFQETDPNWPWATSLPALLEMEEPEDRLQALHQLAYRQWLPAELAAGQGLPFASPLEPGGVPASSR